MATWLVIGLAWAGGMAVGDPAKLPEKVQALGGGEVCLSVPEEGALVLVFLWSECPISNRYAPRLNELAGAWKGEPVRLVGLYVDPTLPDAELLAHGKEYGLTVPLARDVETRLARALGVERVPCAVVVDGKRSVRYVGRIDDQFYALGRSRTAATSRDLRDAVDSVLRGRAVLKDRTEVIGCDLPLP